ncbi:MAG: hypothetical protein HY322_09495 [Betaproteobacteria bacterium]|nr:hypothetical protein [Betaproteobacteria bacterium]
MTSLPILERPLPSLRRNDAIPPDVVLDIDAPIIPAVGAAGLRLGAPFAPAPGAWRQVSPEEAGFPLPAGMIHYTCPAVDLWTEEGLITQISVHGGYRGWLAGAIGIGSSLADLAERVGQPRLRDLNLMVPGVLGFCVDTDGRARPGEAVFHERRITVIYVFRPCHRE